MRKPKEKRLCENQVITIKLGVWLPQLKRKEAVTIATCRNYQVISSNNLVVRKRKFIGIKLYPVSQSLDKDWFIAYYLKDYSNNTCIKKKYIGNLNKPITIVDRLSLAKEYIYLLENNILPNNVQGSRYLYQDPNNNNEFASVIVLCIKALESKKNNIKKHTYSNYMYKLEQFKDWLHITDAHKLPLAEFRWRTCIEYINYLKSKKYHSKTIKESKSLLSHLWEEIIKEYDLDLNNPWKQVKLKSQQSTPFASLPIDIESYLSKIMPIKYPELYLYSQFVYYGFVRCNETRLLKREYLDFKYRFIFIPKELHKSGRDERIVMPLPLYKLLITYGIDQLKDGQYIFYSNEEKTIPRGINYFRVQWNELRVEYKIPKHFKLYGFKHTGNQKLASNTPLNIIQKHNRHVSIEHTQHYIDGMNIENTRKEIDKFPLFGTEANNNENEILNQLKTILNAIQDRN